MKILATLVEPDEGSAQLDGLNLVEQKDETRKILGYLPQEFGVYPKMTAIDLLEHLAVMKGITNGKERKEIVDALLQQTNLWDSRKKALGAYSGGMKQRFGIAQALLANPKLIIVDEPTAGLDPAERNRFLNLLSGIGRQVVVILSTHIVDDVRELCSRMAIISQGQLLLEGEPNQCLEKLTGCIWEDCGNRCGTALASSVPKRIWKMCIFLISLTRKAFPRTEYVLDIFLVRAQIAFSQHFHLHLFRDSLFHDVFFRLGGGLQPHWRR